MRPGDRFPTVVLILLLLLSCAVLDISCAGGGRSAGSAGGELFAMHLQPQLGAQYAQVFDQMNELGVKWVRSNVFWFNVEPREGEFEWSALDGVVARAEQHKLKLMLTIRGISPWGSTQVPPNWQTPGFHAAYPPKDTAQYQAFVSALAGRYKGKGIAWQIENEPNAKAMWGGTREEYVALLKACYAAAHQGEPGAVVLPAGLACGFSQLGYVEVKFARIRGWFDAILDSKSYDAVDLHDYYPPQGSNA